MILRICAIFDVKAKAYMLPQFFPTVAVARRGVAAAVNDPAAGFLHKNPEDFILYHLGDFNDETGQFTQLPNPDVVLHCATAVDPNIRQAVLPFSQSDSQKGESNDA